MGKTLTLTRADGSKVTYVINAKSKVPADLVIGKTVTIIPMASGPGEPVAQTITYPITTKTETVPERSAPRRSCPRRHRPGADFLAPCHGSHE